MYTLYMFIMLLSMLHYNSYAQHALNRETSGKPGHA